MTFKEEVLKRIFNIIGITCSIPMQKGFGGGLGIHFKGSGFYETDYKNK